MLFIVNFLFFLNLLSLLCLLGHMIKDHYKSNLILILVGLDSYQASTFLQTLGRYNKLKALMALTLTPIIDLTMTFFVPYILQTLEFIISNRTLVEEPLHGLAW